MDILSSIMKKVENFNDELTRKFKLKYNPFPKSGIAIINDSDKIIEKLEPVEDSVRESIFNFIQEALSANFNPSTQDDKYISLVVRGEYGSGKTQTLMYIKYLLKSIKSERIRPYVVYVDNPGEKLSQLIGEIVSQIGVENFKKYLWDIFLKYLDENPDVKTALTATSPKDLGLFASQEEASNEVSLSYSNYKELIDKMTFGRSSADIKALMAKLKNYMIQSYLSITDSPTVASTFYDIVSETIGVSKSWDLLTSGSVKELDKREVDVLRAIVKIVCDQMEYTDFIILIDEFEEITAERLKKSEVDNYLRNLRLLIDREKNWCSVFAMTGKALNMVEEYSKPLADRIMGRVVDLKPLTPKTLSQVICNYLSLARTEKVQDELYPFNDEGVTQIFDIKGKNVLYKGSPRFAIKMCYLLLQRAANELNAGEYIDGAFVNKHLDEILK